MITNYLLLRLFGIFACFSAATVAREGIIGGKTVHKATDFPYQVSVQVHGHGHVCGGGIIGNPFILTAAHCILNQNRRLLSTHISVLAGTRNLNRTAPPTLTRRVEKVFFSAEFHPGVQFSHGDVAVLKLADSLQLGHHSHLQKLQLPRDIDSVVRMSTIAGFGWQSYNSSGHGWANGRLEYSWAYELDGSECEAAYSFAGIQFDKHLCARSPAAAFGSIRPYGACVGDAGGPLVEQGQHDHDRTVIGILSRIPPECDERCGPTVYTRIVHYSRMITNVMELDHDLQMLSLRA